jgi:Bacteriophage lambda head decoration protein D
MSVIATDTLRLSNMLKAELWAELGYCREVVTVNEAAAKTYAVGTVLGKVTASGKYKIAVETAVDGSKVAAAIVMADASIAASTDTKLVVLVKGPAAVSKGALVLDATYDNDTKKNVVYADLAAKNILVLDTVGVAVSV